MAATDMTKAGLEIGCKASYLGHEGYTVLKISEAEPRYYAAKYTQGGQMKRSAWFYEGDLIRDYQDAEDARQARIEVLVDAYPGEGSPEVTDTVERWCAVQWDKRNEVYHHIYSDDREELIEQLVGEILEGWLPTAIFDLDMGECIELDVPVPTVTISKQQGSMRNPLALTIKAAV
jgi:hypothetical protein